MNINITPIGIVENMRTDIEDDYWGDVVSQKIFLLRVFAAW